ncbi:MAG: hypothetical protein KKH28_09255 [Elusimicrobia bacterium]|nr:hypothetical protein [Elusimicrobiota bacterium]
MKLKTAVLVPVLACACAGGAFAAYPLATDDAGTVALNSCELEAGYDNSKDRESLSNQSGAFSFKHGLTEKMDIGISLPYRIHPAGEEKPGAASIGLKFSLVKGIVALSFSNELGEKEYFLNTIYTKEFSAVKLHFNAGYLSTGEETKKGSGSYGLALEYPMGKFEAVGEAQGREGGEGAVLLGLRYWIRESLFVAGAIARDFRTGHPRFAAGLHFEF